MRIDCIYREKNEALQTGAEGAAGQTEGSLRLTPGVDFHIVRQPPDLRHLGQSVHCAQRHETRWCRVIVSLG